MRPPIRAVVGLQPTKENSVTFHEHRGPRRRLDASQQRSAAELAALCELGRKWREVWRAEKAAQAEPANGPIPPETKPAAPGSRVRIGEDFAAGIARAEFGRFYWNDKLDGQLKATMTPRRTRGRRLKSPA